MEELNNDNKLLIKLLDNELSDEERAEIQKSEDYKKYRYIITETDQWSLPPVDKQKSFIKLQANKGTAKVIKWHNQPSFRWAAAIALIACFAIYMIIGDTTVTYSTKLGETKTIVLPDNSEVVLMPGSSIALRRRSFKKLRKIEQTGIAYYRVKKGKPFKVNFGNGSLEVLGTTFEINSSPEFSSVSCYSGKVAITNQYGEYILTKGMGLNISTASNEFTFEGEWNSESTKFKNAPLSQVFEALKKQFDVELDYGNVNLDAKFTGEYLHNNLETALKMVCTPMQIKYTIIKSKIELKQVN